MRRWGREAGRWREVGEGVVWWVVGVFTHCTW